MRTEGLLPQFGPDSHLLNLLGWHKVFRLLCSVSLESFAVQDVSQLDPTHIWYLGTGCLLAAAGVQYLAAIMQHLPTADARLDEVFAQFVLFCRSSVPRLYPNVGRFSGNLNLSYVLFNHYVTFAVSDVLWHCGTNVVQF